MQLDTIIARLGGGKPAGNGKWQVRCPAHEDKTASLSVGLGSDGHILLFCHAGCSTEDIVAKIGLEVADLMPAKDDYSKPQIVATYDYRDESGALLYQALRMFPKDFRQRKPALTGGWEWRLGDVRRVPYYLPELIAANPKEVVFIAEGEKDVENLRSIGCVATCNVGGAGKWKQEYSEFLRGRFVAILPDNDEAGRTHAEQVSTSLEGIAAKHRILALPGLDSKGDVSDWIKAGGTKQQLLELLKKPEQEAPAKPVPTKREIRTTTLADATASYIERIMQGGAPLISLGIPDVDYAIGGGVERGEMVILAARPSHGKSAIALQCVHAWTREGRKCMFISEEMSSLALGKRSLQFLSDVPQEHWEHRINEVQGELADYRSKHAECIIVESCGSVEMAVEQITKGVTEHKVECVVVDYAQLLTGKGRTRYEQVTHTSVALRHLASSLNVVLLVLAQLSRGVETRDEFVPLNSDLKDSGQIEQDADVILHLCWPYKIDANRDAKEYLFFVGKNRNRAINQGIVNCRFIPSRQMVMPPPPPKNYEHAFDTYNRGDAFEP